ncbi:polysaccharide pyruvyl transferase family protein [Alkalihalobacillus sp. R86527]|uniref:polysaccharide pyruvyl transferase family protein n=1 Tax=Alkalihalobacillus sp. R86527 TaxID=3093863 RepID=UPI00366AC469
MKCGILTFHRAQNFGAILQAYALQQSVEKLGAECEVIDYRSPHIEKYYQPITLKTLPSIKKMAAIVIKNGRVKNNRDNFDLFTNNHLKTSSIIYEDKGQLENSKERYDKFITGSDQVWSYLTAGFDKSYFLDFVDKKEKKHSYAASFGVESIPTEYKKEYTDMLKDFENISLREEQGAQILNELLSIDPLVVLDPTMLLNKTEWSEISHETSEDQEYLLLYVIAESKSILSLAKEIAKKRDLKIIYINDRLYKRSGMENRSKISVDEWIALFLNANCIVTNSFHGVAFSINFQKDFFMQYLPEPAKVNSRLENILNKFELNARHITDIYNFDKVEDINYSQVHKILESERSIALDYLSEVIEIPKNNKKSI